MTFDDLEQLAARKSEINLIVERIECARSKGQYRGVGERLRVGGGMGYRDNDFCVAAIDIFERVLLERLKELVVSVLRTEIWVSQISDSKIRQIVYLRFLRGKSWTQIAFRMGYHDEQVPRRQLTRFLARETRKIA